MIELFLNELNCLEASCFHLWIRRLSGQLSRSPSSLTVELQVHLSL